METFSIRNLTFSYPGRQEPALKDVTLRVYSGEFLALCGQSGSGKTTLLRNLKPALCPHGTRSGSILFEGREIDSLSPREQASLIGYVLQNPDSQIVTDKVWHELAFGLESLGADQDTIRLRVAEMASFFGIESWFHREVHTLSGGQKQLLNLAAVMVMQPEVLILDEPVSQLDPIAAADFIETVIRVNRELGTTIIISEHRLEEIIPAADKVAVMDRGEMAACGAPEYVCSSLLHLEHPMFSAMPAPAQIAACFETECLQKDSLRTEGAQGDMLPLNVRDGRKWLDRILDGRKGDITTLSEREPAAGGIAAEMKNIWFAYEKGTDIIRGLDLNIYQGEMLAVVGGNGTGKTTLMGILSGVNKPQRGKVATSLKRAMLPQNPQTLFTEDTVYGELDSMRAFFSDGDGQSWEEEIRKIASLVEIEEILECHPYDISGGEQQRAALAKVLLSKPQLLILDEPTKGMDSSFKGRLAAILKRLLENGMTVVMVSHDIEFCGAYADRCAMIFDGKIVTEGAPCRFFAGNSFYTTAANRMSRHVFENAVTVRDVVELLKLNLCDSCQDEKDDHVKNDARDDDDSGGAGFSDDPGNRDGGEASGILDGDETSDILNSGAASGASNSSAAPEQIVSAGRLPSWAGDILMIIIAGATMIFGYFALDNRWYMGVSVLLIIYAMVPFFWRFERSHPQAREIVMLVVMVATAVVGRAAFFMIPNFKPMLAIVIIAGAALGREAGFLTGALAAFVSNFFFGQGPWTPWQMMAAALVGYVAGMLFFRYGDRVRKLPLIVFGMAAAMILYGGIVDIWTILVITEKPTAATIAAVYGSAFYFNLVHGLATALFLFLLARPMISGINRVRLKYGMNIT